MVTDLQHAVIARAKELLKGRPVCLDQLQDDETIKVCGVDECARQLYVDTLYWDGDLL